MFKYTKHFILVSVVSVLLTACGGSSDGGGLSPGPSVSNLRITISPVKNTIPANDNNYPILIDSPFMTQVNVNVTFDNGTPIPDATNIEMRTSDVQVAPISTLDDPDTNDVNEFTTLFGSVGNESAGGNGTFFLHGFTPGNVTLTASAVDPQTGRTSTASIQYTISQGPGVFDRLTVESLTQTMPANVFNLTPQQAFGTVYMTEAEISFRDPLGNAINPAAADGAATPTVGVAINPVTVAAFSTLDDGGTDDINEIFVLLGQGPVDMVAGKGTIFIWSDTPGTATITVTALDQFTGATIDAQLEIEVTAGGDTTLPSSITVTGSGASYINGSGGSQSQIVQALLTAAGGVPVPDQSSFNNVMVSMSTDANNSGEKLSGVDVSGNNVQGQSINIATNNGTGSFQLLSGNDPNTVIITATTDRADNNVDNGLQDPIQAQTSVVISDGVLFGLDITVPNLNSLFINNVDDNVAGQDGVGNLDGSYSMTVSAIGTDKGGNPALPQTIQFGLIDSPVVGFPEEGPGVFPISGTDGDPQEGGSGFTSIGGEFLTAAGGAQPGDTLMVFAEEELGNEDLESAVTVQSIQSETSLTIAERFNRNDLTGTINDDLGIFDYIIGRAVDGNIDATATIDSNGVATVQMNYPVSKLGKIAGVYAKGQGETVNSVTRAVTDVELLLYPGAASVTGTELAPFLTVTPSVIPANQETPITACFFDAASHPIQGRAIGFAYVGGFGTGSIDGVEGSGAMVMRTGADGCATGIANVTGVIESSDTNGFNFFAGGVSCPAATNTNQEVCVRVANPGATYLTASPMIFNFGGVKIIDLFLFGGDGVGIPNVPLFVTCESNGGSMIIQVPPGSTDENGMTSANILANIDGFGESFSGTCTFTTGSGTPSVDVEFNGTDLCEFNNSPPPPC